MNNTEKNVQIGYKNCYGAKSDLKPCNYINSCELCINCTGYREMEMNIESYLIAKGRNKLLCKRDYPDFKGFTKEQIADIYKNMQDKDEFTLDNAIKLARSEGILKE